MACKTKDGTRLSKASYYSMRTALFHLYRIFGKTQSNKFQKELTTLFKGFLRTVAQELQHGNGKISTGKIPLPFDLYEEICRWMLEDPSPAGRFAHLFLVLSWNLACRSSNTRTIHFHHMRWIQDALQIFFAHMKNDQTGDRPRDPRHVYSNPYNPIIDPILTLISYLLVTPPSNNSTALFPGKDQYNRYSKYLHRLLQRKKDYIERKYGIKISDIGGHSARKGASTYMTSGCVNGPMQQAVNIRCGWRMQGVTDTYCRYEQAGDQYCGRVVCGLPLFSYRFAIMPPEFMLENEDNIKKLDELVDTFFPNLPVDLNGIIRHGFASLALREDWLRGMLPENHCLWQTSVFWNENFIDLKNCVKLELGVGDNNLELNHVSTRERNCTGIPNHVVLLASQRSLVLQQKKLITNNDSIPLLIQNAIKDSGVVSNDYNRVVQELEHISQKLHEMQNQENKEDGENTEEQSNEGDNWRSTTTMQISLHLHEGEYIRIHPDFIFPKNCSLRDMFFRYHLTDSRNGIPPLKVLDSKSVRHIKRGKGTLSDIRFLMRYLERAANEKGRTCNRLASQEEATRLFEEIKDSVYKYDKESERAEQYKWATWVRKIRRARRQNGTRANVNGEEDIGEDEIARV